MNSSSTVTIILDYSNVYLLKGDYNESYITPSLVRISKSDSHAGKLLKALVNSSNGRLNKKKEILDIDFHMVRKRQSEINKEFRKLMDNPVNKNLILTEDGDIYFSTNVCVYDSVSKKSWIINSNPPPIKKGVLIV